MRLTRVQMSVRAMLVAVAVVAAGLTYLHHKRSAAFRSLAAAHARKADEYGARVKRSRSTWESFDGRLGYGAAYLARRNRMTEQQADQSERTADQLKRFLDRDEVMFAYYKGLEQKYRRAAASPWLPLGPDPPPPFPGAPTVTSPAVSGERADETPPPIALVASLSQDVFELGDHVIVGGAVPLTIEYRNHSERPVTICPIGLAVVTDEEGKEPELTVQGREYQNMPPPGETRRRHSSIVIEPGGTFRDEGLDLTGLYRLPSGRYSVCVFHDDPPLSAASAPVRFEVRRVKRVR